MLQRVCPLVRRNGFPLSIPGESLWTGSDSPPVHEPRMVDQELHAARQGRPAHLVLAEPAIGRERVARLERAASLVHQREGSFLDHRHGAEFERLVDAHVADDVAAPEDAVHHRPHVHRVEFAVHRPLVEDLGEIERAALRSLHRLREAALPGALAHAPGQRSEDFVVELRVAERRRRRLAHDDVGHRGDRVLDAVLLVVGRHRERDVGPQRARAPAEVRGHDEVELRPQVRSWRSAATASGAAGSSPRR